MAFGNSGLFCQTFIDVMDPTNLALDLTLTTHKVALFTNTVTPDFSATSPVPAYGVSPFNANEVSGTGYTAGGVAIGATPTLVVSSGTIVWDAPDVQWTTSTITNARGCLIYADALAGDNAIVAVTFGADYSTSAGTFQIQWNAGGIFTIDMTP